MIFITIATKPQFILPLKLTFSGACLTIPSGKMSFPTVVTTPSASKFSKESYTDLKLIKFYNKDKGTTVAI